MIKIKKSHKGRLHRALGFPDTKEITEKQLERATHSRSAAIRKEAQFALNARHFKHTR